MQMDAHTKYLCTHICMHVHACSIHLYCAQVFPVCSFDITFKIVSIGPQSVGVGQGVASVCISLTPTPNPTSSSSAPTASPRAPVVRLINLTTNHQSLNRISESLAVSLECDPIELLFLSPSTFNTFFLRALA